MTLKLLSPQRRIPVAPNIAHNQPNWSWDAELICIEQGFRVWGQQECEDMDMGPLFDVRVAEDLRNTAFMLSKGPEETPMSDLPTRQTCARCHRISLFDFHSPMWKGVAGPWSNDILCLMCFAVLGDERGLRWEEGLTITPCSLVSHLEFAAALTPGDTDHIPDERPGSLDAPWMDEPDPGDTNGV